MTASLHPVRGTVDEVLALLADWDLADDPEPLIIETSGSTGRPKRVLLSRAALRASVAATHDRLGGPGRWMLTLPPTYVAGVQVLYRSIRAGVEPVLADLSQLAGPSGSREGDYLSLVPTQLHRLLDVPELVTALRDLRAVLVGGGPAQPADLARAAEEGIRVVRTYGMSETGGGCVYDGVPLDGVEVEIRDEAIWLRGPMLFDGYADDPGLTASVLVDGWLRTHDLGRFEDGVLTVLGREDDVIISGGVKVPAQAVEQQVGEPSVVIGRPDPEWGERVVAVFPGVPPSLEELRDRVVPRAWAPREAVSWGGDLPLLPGGKVDRLRIRERLR